MPLSLSSRWKQEPLHMKSKTYILSVGKKFATRCSLSLACRVLTISRASKAIINPNPKYRHLLSLYWTFQYRFTARCLGNSTHTHLLMRLQPRITCRSGKLLAVI